MWRGEKSPITACQRRTPPSCLSTKSIWKPENDLPLHQSYPLPTCADFFAHQNSPPNITLFHHSFPTVPQYHQILNHTIESHFSCFALVQEDKTFQFVYTFELSLNSRNRSDHLGNGECLWACIRKKQQGTRWTAEMKTFLWMTWIPW